MILRSSKGEHGYAHIRFYELDEEHKMRAVDELETTNSALIDCLRSGIDPRCKKLESVQAIEEIMMTDKKGSSLTSLAKKYELSINAASITTALKKIHILKDEEYLSTTGSGEIKVFVKRR